VLLLLLVGALSTGIIMSCGGGGGDSPNGELCDECGVSPDGPCQSGFTVVPGPDQPPPCDAADAPNPCPLTLICRRKVDSAQQRCYPANPANPSQVNFQWRCDGSRPGGTAVPEPTSTPVPSNTTVTSRTPACGNDFVDEDEDCDTTQLNGQTCETRGCSLPGGILSCSIACTFNTFQCNGVCP
jgi:hypothetical protein